MTILSTPQMQSTASQLSLRSTSVSASDPARSTNAVDPRMQQAADGFEALFLQQMVQTGRAASLGDDLMGGTGTKRMQDMLDTTLTEQAAGQANLGLADAIVRQFAPFTGNGTD